MRKQFFTFRPVTSGSPPKYPSRNAAVALASGFGLLLGAGCQVALEENPDTCTAGDAVCENASTLVLCDENLVRQVINCDDYCVANFGTEWVSHGCDAGVSDNQCQCEYDILDGGIGACTPEEIYCNDAQSITYCELPAGDTWGTPVTVTCDEYCHLTLGPEYSSPLGCDANLTENLCQCEYDILDGAVAQCNPGELECIGDSQLGLCNEFYTFDYILCADKCVADLGEGAISLSCDATDPTDPCNCVIPE